MLRNTSFQLFVGIYLLLHQIQIRQCNLTSIPRSNGIKISNFLSSTELSAISTKNDFIKPFNVINGWEIVTDNWPKNESSPFFFSTTQKYSDKIILKFTQNFKDKFQKQNQILDVKFMIWIAPFSKPSPLGVKLIFNPGEKEVNLFENYIMGNFTHSWMPYSLRINSENLNIFSIEFFPEQFFLAFKEFQVSYISTQKKLNINDQNDPKFSQFKHNEKLSKLCFPSKMQNDFKETFYFPDCSLEDFCSIEINPFNESFNFQVWTKDNINMKIRLSENKSFKKIINEWTTIIIKKVEEKQVMTFLTNSLDDCNSLIVGVTMQNAIKPKNNFLEYETIREKFNNNYFSSNKISKIFLNSSNVKSIDKVCIKIQINSLEAKSLEENININYYLGVSGNSFQYNNSLTSIPIFAHQSQYETSTCLSNFLNFKAQNFAIALEIKSKNLQKRVFSFSVYSEIVSSNKIGFLYPFAKEKSDNVKFEQERLSNQTFDLIWQRQWNKKSFNFDDYFEFDKNSINFKVKKNSFKNRRVILTTHWARYDQDLFSNENWKFKLETENQNLIVLLRVCDEFGFCFQTLPTNFNFISSQYEFKFSQILTKLFRLEFIFEFSESDVNAKISFLNTNHPCFHFNGSVISSRNNCKNKGICLASEQIENFYTCNCPNGYSDKKCEKADPCLISNIQEKKETGNDFCKKQNLSCQTNDDQFICVCKNEASAILWNTKRQKCESVPTLKNSSHSIFFKFSPNFVIPRDYDICFTVDYSIKNSTINQLENFSNLQTILKIKKEKILLLRHQLIQDSLFKFCLQNFISKSFLHSKVAYDLLFKVENFSKVSNIEINLNQMKLLLEPLKKKVSLPPEKVEEYNLFFKEALQYKNWEFFDFHKKIATENFNNVTKLLVKVNSNSSNLFSLVSPWLIYNKEINLISLAWSKKCSKAQNFKILKFKIVYFKNAKSPDIINLKMTLDENQIKVNINQILTKIKYFKFVIELMSNCDEVILEPLQMLPNLCEKKCGQGTCNPDYKNGKFTCKCLKNMFGSNCQFTQNLCKEIGSNLCVDFPISKNEQNLDLCVPLTNSSYECKCWPGLYNWNSNTLKCNPIYEIKENTFLLNPKEKSFLDPLVSNRQFSENGKSIEIVKWMDKINFSQIAKKFTKHFYLTQEPITSELQISIPTVSEKEDYCLNMMYILFSGSQLGISLGNTKQIFWTSLSNQNNPFDSKICIRSLIDPEKINRKLNNEKFKIYSNISNTHGKDFQLVALQLKPETVQVSNLKINSYFDYKNFDKNIFQFKFPSQVWKIEGKVLKFNYNNSKESLKPLTSLILSKWFSNDISMWANHTLRFKWQHNGTKNLSLVPVIFNSKMKDITTIAIKGNQQKIKKDVIQSINILNKEINDKYYRFGFRVNINKQSKIETNFNFEISQLDLDDFCSLPTKVLENDEKPCKNGGTCLVKPYVKNRGYECNCMIGYDGDDCSEIDACTRVVHGKSGSQICKEKNAGKCVRKINDFICDCNNDGDSNWSKKFKECIGIPACLKNNPCSEKESYCVQKNKEAICECRKGYKHIQPNNSLSYCEKINPCQDKKCGPNQNCVNFYDQALCFCKIGYIGIKENRGFNCIKEKKCDSKLSNPCEHICEEKNTEKGFECSCHDGYELNNQGKCFWKGSEKFLCTEKCTAIRSYCDLNKKSCVCNKDFIYQKNFTKNGEAACILNKNEKLLECPFGEAITNNLTGRLECKCSKELFKLNPKNFTCDLKPICNVGGDGYNECNSKNALCFLNTLDEITSEKKLYRCKCKPGQHWDQDPTSPNAKCLNVCEHPRIRMHCEKLNAVCDPLIDNISIFNETTTDLNKFCKCKEGLEHLNKKNGTCYIFTKERKDDISRIYNLKLTISKKTFQFLKEYNELENLYNLKITNLTALNSFKEKIPSKIFFQLIQNLEQSMNHNTEMIQNQMKTLQLYEEQKIVTKILKQFNNQYISANIDYNGEISIQVVQCQNLPDENANNYIDCDVQIKINNLAKFLEKLVSAKMKQLSAEAYFKNVFKENCHYIPSDDHGNDCMFDVFAKKNEIKHIYSTYLKTTIYNNFSNSSLQNFKLIPLILQKASIYNVNINLFDACKSYNNTCPVSTECKSTYTTYKCDCEYIDKSPIFQFENSTKNHLGATVRGCALKEKSFICNMYSGNNSLYQKDNCSLTKNLTEDGTLSIELFFSCDAKAYSREFSTMQPRDSFVYIKNECVDKFNYFCNDFNCSKHGNCKLNGLKPYCECLPGWKGEKCNEKIQDDERKWLWIGIYVLVSLFSLTILIIVSIMIAKCLKKSKTCENNNQLRLTTGRSSNIEMAQYDAGGTCRDESPKLPQNLSPRFKITSTDFKSKTHSIDKNLASTNESNSKNKQSFKILNVKRINNSANGENSKPAPKCFTMPHNVSSSEDSSSESASSRKRSPFPIRAKPIVLNRSILLNSKSTSDKQTSFQYIPSRFRNLSTKTDNQTSPV